VNIIKDTKKLIYKSETECSILCDNPTVFIFKSLLIGEESKMLSKLVEQQG